MKHDNTTMLDSFRWNWSRSVLNDDAIFIASYMNIALANEIKWPSQAERQKLASELHDFLGCIGIIDGILIKIHRPWNNDQHAAWFNGRKKIYATNNIVVVDHHGLFIYIDMGYLGSFNDVNCLQQSELYKWWHDYFVHIDEYFEYFPGDAGNVVFIKMRQFHSLKL